MNRIWKRFLAAFIVMSIVCNCINLPESMGQELSTELLEDVQIALEDPVEEPVVDPSEPLSEEKDVDSENEEQIPMIEEDVPQEEIQQEIDAPQQEDGAASPESVPQTSDEEAENGELFETVETTILLASGYSAANSTNIPHSVAELEAAGKTKFDVVDYNDVLALQELSKLDSLEGYTFEFGKLNNEESGLVWDLKSIEEFKGFGSESHPFQGYLTEDIDVGVTFKLNCPLFDCLGSGATIENFRMTLENASSGIANTFVALDNKPVTYKNVQVSGTVSVNSDTTNSYGAAGGLYGVVRNGRTGGEENEYEFVIYDKYVGEQGAESNGVDVSELTVTGWVAGGCVGVVEDNVKVLVKSANNLAKEVVVPESDSSKAAGGIVGMLAEGSSLEIENPITVSNSVKNDYQKAQVATGGLIGYCEGATVTSEFKVTKNSNMPIKAGIAGGYIGYAKDSKITISKFQLDGYVKCGVGLSNSNLLRVAGGVVGKYESATNAAETASYVNISDIGISTKAIASGDNAEKNTYANCMAGGVFGYIAGNNVTVSNLNESGNEYKFLPKLGYDAYNDPSVQSSSGYVGGVAGRVSGKNILVSDVILRFDKANTPISGHYVGGVFAYVDSLSKMKLNNITIQDYVIYSSSSDGQWKYVGGILGYVNEGCVIALDGKIDVSSITYNASTNANGLYATTGKGYIAGAQKESLIYFEKGATYNKNEMSDNVTHSTWESEEYYGYSKGYTLADVSTYGGIYKNVEDPITHSNVIQFGNAYGQEVTGTLTYTTSAEGRVTYELKNVADALRLSVALNTMNASDINYALRFGQGCFASGATGKSLLDSDYKVTGDINFKDAGIVSLCRNDSTSNYVYSGTFYGVPQNGKNPTITLYIANKYNTCAAIFPAVKDTTFRNIKVSGGIYYAQGAAALAYRAEGNLTLENVSTDITIYTRSYVSSKSEVYFFGGLIAYYNMKSGKLTCKKCEIAPKIKNIRCQQYVGGMIGYVYTGKPSASPATYNMEIEEITVKSQLAAASNFSNGVSDSTWKFQARMAGLIAGIGCEEQGWKDQNNAAGLETYVTDKTYAKMKLIDITVDGALIDTSQINQYKNYVRVTGGFLGYQWDNMEVSSNVSPEGTAGIIVKNNSTINSRGHVGGLISVFSGKLDFNSKIDLQSMTMTDKQSGQKFCGLLIGDGRYAVINLTECTSTEMMYQIDTSNVKVSGYSNFDEIVGVNCELADDAVNSNDTRVEGTYANGGIVNIMNPNFSDMTSDSYQSYTNRVVTTNNQFTRYYYNLFGTGYTANMVSVSGTTATLDSEKDLMLWHLYQYSNEYIKRFLTSYFSEDPSTVTTWNLSGNFDMNGYSFYPTKITSGTYQGQNNATITLYGETIEKSEATHTMDANKKIPSSSALQHYMMHAALFEYASGTSTSPVRVSGIKFQGTATNLGTDSGVLFAHDTSGTIAIENIVLDGVRIANYTDERYIGLMVSNFLDDTDVSINNIETTDASYNLNKDSANQQIYAASALIGTVGDSSADGYRITFINMKVDDNKSVNNKVFKYASFIYSYDSVDNSSTNQTFGLYTFTESDTVDKRNVTYGDELKYGVDYYDKDRDAGDSGDVLNTVITNANAGTYIPYVYTTKTIFVNPRNGNLDKGCGTYEDPYIISNRKQFLNLYCYLTGSSSYDDIFNTTDSTRKKWSVNPIGGGSSDKRCKIGVGESSHTAIQYGADGFPTQDDLRSAYYLITADLDLSAYSDLTEYVMEYDFSGLGTARYPFTGVIVGRVSEGTGTRAAKITFPKSKTDTKRMWVSYGFIQCMEGAVVKDLELTTQDEVVRVSSVGGGVAATIYGGDNIIDNVKVDIKFAIETTGTGNDRTSSVKTGGYAGVIKKGSLIVRNLTNANVSNYALGYYANETWTSIAASELDRYRWNGRVAGLVEDGCIIYEDTNTPDSWITKPQVLEASEFGFSAGYPLSYSFPMINGKRLDSECSTKITVKGNSTAGFELQAHNSTHLEILALALNAGAFSIYDSGEYSNTHNNGYGYGAVCRKAQYSHLGCGAVSATGIQDWKDATTEDDSKSYYPYFYKKYMDFSGVSGYQSTQSQETVDGKDKRISLLNWSDGLANYGSVAMPKDAVSTIKLVNTSADYVYDVTVYGRSFRGFGQLYSTIYDTFSYADFRMNFDGQNKRVKINMVRDWDSRVLTAGMFNDLVTDRQSGGFTIKDLVIYNSHFIDENSGADVGAIAGHVKGVWNFANVSLSRDTKKVDSNGSPIPDIQAAGHNGGLVGQIHYYSTSSSDDTKQKISFTECKVNGTANSEVNILGTSNTGGLVGYVTGELYGSYKTYYGDISFTDCEVEYSNISSSKANVGGYVGRVGESYNNSRATDNSSVGRVLVQQTKNNIKSVCNSNIQATGSSACSAGGIIGISVGVAYGEKIPLTINAVIVDNVRVNSSTPDQTDNNYVRYGTGGIVGSACIYRGSVNSDKNIIVINNISISYSVIGDTQTTNRIPSGGVIGEAYTSKMTIDEISISHTQVLSYNNTTGGVLANNRVVNTLDIQKITLNQAKVKSVKNSAGGVIGSTVTYSLTTCTCKTIEVISSEIYAGYTQSGSGANITYAFDEVTNAKAGGVVGQSNQTISYYNFEDIHVGNGTTVAGYYSGGMTGSVSGYEAITTSGYVRIGCHLEAGQLTSDANRVTIFGASRAGGIHGSNESSSTEKCKAQVRIYDTRIGVYSTATNPQRNLLAGGLAGYFSNSSSKYDDVEIKNCVIAAKREQLSTSYAFGVGMMSGCLGSTSLYVYRPVLTDNSIGYATEVLGLATFKTLTNTSETVKLLTGSDASQSVRYDAISGGVTETNIGDYSFRIGTYLGYRDGDNSKLFILRPEENYTPVDSGGNGYKGNRAVIDVGNKTTGTADYTVLNGYGYPYEWRKSCHIVYFEPQSDPTNTNAIFLDSSLIKNNENEYLYSSIDTFVNEYRALGNMNDSTDKERTNAFLDSYKLNVKLDEQTDNLHTLLDYYDKCEYEKVFNGVKVVYADGAPAQHILDSAVAAVTNIGGINASEITSISVQKAKINKNGKIEKIDGTPTIRVDSNKKLWYQDLTYDEVTDTSDGKQEYTISLVSFSYGWKCADDQYKYETLYVPVFVVQRIAFYNNLHIMSGENYSLSAAHNDEMSYQGAVTVAHDSTYTLFSELAYGSGRAKYPRYYLDKKLKFQIGSGNDSSGNIIFENASVPTGLKLTLVDVQTGQAYYYTTGLPENASYENSGYVNFASFSYRQADGSLTYFVNRMMSEITVTTNDFKYGTESLSGHEFGLEQFYIYVDPSGAEILNTVYRVSVDTDGKDERGQVSTNYTAQLNFFDRVQYSGIQITWRPGMIIEFDESEDVVTDDPLVTKKATKISGAINQREQVSIDARIKITSKSPRYWEERRNSNNRFIDSENKNKYLEVAVYLINNATGEYVNLPAGTYVTLNGDEEHRQQVVNQSVTYAYRDWGYEFPIDDVTEELSSAKELETSSGNTVCNYFNMVLDFSVADLDNYVDVEKFDVYMELRRTSDPSYPLEGSKIDDFSQTVSSYGDKEMAVALEVKDIMDLGINTYRQNQTEYKIPFTTKIDFTNMIYNNRKSDVDKCLESYYLVTYRLKKKVPKNDGYTYVTLGEDSTIDDNGTPENPSANPNMSVGEHLKLELSSETSDTLTCGSSDTLTLVSNYDGEVVYQMVISFDEDDEETFRNGTIVDGNPIPPYMVMWGMNLTIDTNNIYNVDLSNYKVEVTVLPCKNLSLEDENGVPTGNIERGSYVIPPTDRNATLKDYYIFTIGKLKNDL